MQKNLLFFGLLLLLLSGCLGQLGPIDVDEFTFNDKLKPDLSRLSDDEEANSPPPTYSNGLTEGHRIITEVYPHLDPRYNESYLTSLRRSDCYWAPEGEGLFFSWEAVALGVSPPEDYECNISDIGGCTVSDPITRQVFTCREEGESNWEDLTGYPWIQSSGANISFQKCTGISGPSNSFNECQQRTDNCRILQNPCGNSTLAENYPFCQFNCPQNVDSSATYKLALSTSSNSIGVQKIFKPTINMVRSLTTIARKMNLNSEDDNEYNLIWEVENGPASWWKENFSPNIMITKISFFFIDQDGNRIYFHPTRVEFHNNLIYIDSCEPDQGSSDISLLGCSRLLEFTPAYRKGDPGVKIYWRLDIPKNDDRYRNIDIRNIYIEFTLANPRYQEVEYIINPEVLNLGAKLTNQVYHLIRALELENLGGQKLIINEIRVLGNRANEVAITESNNQNMPIDVWGGNKVGFDLTIMPTSLGRIEGTILFDISATGRTYSTGIGYGLIAVSPELDVTPQELLDFRSGGVSGQPDILEKHFIAANIGSSPLEISNMTLTGVNPQSFAVYFDNGEPIAYYPIEILPGDSKIFLVRYSPHFLTGSSKTHTAQLRVESNGLADGVTEINLRGRYRVNFFGGKKIEIRPAPKVPRGLRGTD